MSDKYATVVTAYYKIPSKRSSEEYLEYARNLLSKCPAHIILFTSKEFSQAFRKIRGDLPLTVFEEEFKSPVKTWASPIIWKIAALKNNKRHPAFKNAISPELLQLWLSKALFMQEAIARLDTPSQTNVFMWCDIGCVRSNNDKLSVCNWPLLSKLNVIDNRLRFFQRTPIPKEYNYRIDYNSVIAGSNIFGNIEAWKTASNDIHDIVIDNIKKYKDGLNDESIYLKLIMTMPEKYTTVGNPSSGDWFQTFALHS
jgi:hypothetical protein